MFATIFKTPIATVCTEPVAKGKDRTPFGTFMSNFFNSGHNKKKYTAPKQMIAVALSMADRAGLSYEPVATRKRMITHAAPLYVQRKLINTTEFIAWAKSQGFAKTVPPGELHMTIVFSKAPVEWSALPPETDNLSFLGDQGQRQQPVRTVGPLGSEGAVVLKFQSERLQYRHSKWRDQGASWDYESFQPHITISYDGTGVDLSKVTPYTGPLVFGPEIYEDINLDYTSKLVEKQEGFAHIFKTSEGARKAWLTRDRLHKDTLPSAPGTEPIPEGHVRLYHQTGEENISSITSTGLTIDHAQGIEGPRAIYASEKGFYGDPTKRPTIEFHVPKEKWSDPFVLQDVPPENMIAAHLPWHRQARYMQDNDLVQAALNGKYDDLEGEFAQAVAYVKRAHGAKKSDVLQDVRSYEAIMRTPILVSRRRKPRKAHPDRADQTRVAELISNGGASDMSAIESELDTVLKTSEGARKAWLTRQRKAAEAAGASKPAPAPVPPKEAPKEAPAPVAAKTMKMPEEAMPVVSQEGRTPKELKREAQALKLIQGMGVPAENLHFQYGPPLMVNGGQVSGRSHKTTGVIEVWPNTMDDAEFHLVTVHEAAHQQFAKHIAEFKKTAVGADLFNKAPPHEDSYAATGGNISGYVGPMWKGYRHYNSSTMGHGFRDDAIEETICDLVALDRMNKLPKRLAPNWRAVLDEFKKVTGAPTKKSDYTVGGADIRRDFSSENWIVYLKA